MGELNETQRYFIEEHVEDFREGQITRRELFRRVSLIAGSATLATTILAFATSACSAPVEGPAPAGRAPARGAILRSAVRATAWDRTI